MSLFGHKKLSPEQVEKFAARGDLKGLAKALADDDIYVRQKAAHLLGLADLGYVGTGSRADYQAQELLTEPLLAMLNEKDQNSRQHAAEACRAFCDGRAVEPLIALLDDASISPMLFVRQAAAEALGAIGDLRAAEPLARQIADPAGWDSLGVAAREALVQLGAEGIDMGVDFLLRSLRTANGEVNDNSIFIVQQLAKIGGPKGQEGVTKLTEDLSGAKGVGAKVREEARLRLEYWSHSTLSQ